MRLLAFIKDKFLSLLLYMVCMGISAGFLRMTGSSGTVIALLALFWLLVLGIYGIAAYLERRRYFQKTEELLEKLDQRYLLGELMPQSFRLEDQLYGDMIRRSNKSVIERIRKIEEEQKEYREYIESWVHEIKSPITGISLLCENGRKQKFLNPEVLHSIALENQKTENYVDMALYYARSGIVHQDYLIRKTDLSETVYAVLEKNRMLLMENQVCAQVDCPDFVYTDQKWIMFILNQVILNSVKYKKEKLSLQISSRNTEKNVVLSVVDNGTGIRQEELGRIFDKGFTGSNGRMQQRSTGMGLYLCKKLCLQLGIEITAEALWGEGTRICLKFPVSRYLERDV